MRSSLIGLLFTTIHYSPIPCVAFAPTLAQHDVGRRQQHLVVRRAGFSDFGEREGQASPNDSRTDVRNLLTQRAIQSFLYLSESLRDPHSGKWIEEFLETEGQLHYHGTGAAYIEKFGGSWDGPLLAMMDRPKDVVVVSAKKTGKGHKGWSKNNPYLEDRYVEFEIDIDPVSLASRILSVREQIAKEWQSDLDILIQANERILESYFKLAREERAKKDDDLVTTPPSVFERTATSTLFLDEDLNDNTPFGSSTSSSPFRKGNFDLLYNLCTQASVHRVLRELKQDEVAFEWLRGFYTDRVADYFDGNQKYGRADDFVDDLLSATPSIVTMENGKSGFADPLALVEHIIDVRSQIASEWKDVMANVPQDHMDGIRPVLLNKQMAAWGQKPLEDGGGFE